MMIVLSMLACNLPSNVPASETPTLLASASPTIELPTNTPPPTQTLPPTNTPPPTLTATPTVPVASPRDVNVNCRLGPGTAWVPLSALLVGQTSQITGKTGDGAWWNIVDPQNSSRRCWVSASVVNTAGNIASVPIAEAPQATVTRVTVDVDPKTINIGGCVGPIQPSDITGSIETNGPTLVRWHFETQLGGNLGNENTNFDAFGTREFDEEYTPPLTEGTYWIRLIVTEPNDMQAEVRYTVDC
jgi:hypothetical protein